MPTQKAGGEGEAQANIRHLTRQMEMDTEKPAGGDGAKAHAATSSAS